MHDPLANEDRNRQQEGAPFWASSVWRGRLLATSMSTWIAAGIGFAGSVLAARGLGLSEFGEAVLALMIVGLLSVLFDLPLEEGILHHGSRELADGRIGRLRLLLTIGLRLDLGIGAAVFLAVVLTAPAVARLAGGDGLDPNTVRLAALSLLPATANGTTGAVLLLARRPDLRALCALAASGFRLAGAAVGGAAGSAEALLIAWVAASAGGAALQALVAWRAAWRDWARATPAGPTWDRARALLGFGMHTSLAGGLGATRAGLVAVVLGRMSGPSAVGLLDVALLPVSAATLALGPFRTALLPEQARLWALGHLGALRRTLRSSGRAGLLVGIPGAVAGWFALPLMIGAFYPGEFAGAILPARVLLVAAVLEFALCWNRSIPTIVGRPDLRVRVALIEFAMVIAILPVLAGLGATGGAVALTAAAAVSGVAWLVIARTSIRPALQAETRRAPADPVIAISS